MKVFATIVVSYLFLNTLVCRAQNSTIDAMKRGVELIRGSYNAHGGVNSTDSLKLKFSVSNKKNITIGQTYAADTHGDEYIMEGGYSVDKKKKMEIGWNKVPMSGFEFTNKYFIANGKAKVYAVDRKKVTESPARTVIPNYFPQFILAEILKNPYSIRYAGESSQSQEPIYLVTGIRGSDLIQLGIDQKTLLVSSVTWITTGFGVAGDEERNFSYSKYIKVGSVQIPQQVAVFNTNQAFGNSTNNITIDGATDKFEITSADLQRPEGFVPPDYSYRKTAEAIKVGEGLYMVENSALAAPTYPFSYNVLFAEFENYVLVVEAPWDEATSIRVIDQIKKTIPGKPIKYLVQSHHHEDHIGGIRTYIAEGVTILVSPSNVELIKKIAKALFTANPDKLAKNPVAPTIETISKKKHIIKDAKNETIIMDIGPNEHTKENLVVYFPNQKLLYQADMINEGEYPPTSTSKEFIATLKSLKLKVETMVGTHGKVLDKGAIDALFSK